MIQAEREAVDAIIKNSKKSIWVTFQKVGFHYYPAAISEPQLADVSYLGNKHRHLFKFKVTIDVFHQDRELEFHQFLNFCESLFDKNTIDIDSKSCEMLADDLYFNIAQKYPNRNVQIEVSEDGEVGSTTQYLFQP